MIKDLVNTIIDASRERLKNPFAGAFIISWIAINWKPIFIVLFSEKSVIERITIVEEQHSDITSTLIYPILFALFYVIASQYIMWLLDYVSNKGWKGRKQGVYEKLKFEIGEKQKIAKEEFKLEEERAGKRSIEDLNNKIEALRNDSVSKDKIITSKDELIKSLEIEIDDLKNKVHNINYDSNKDLTKLYDEYISFFNHNNIQPEMFGEVCKHISENKTRPPFISDSLVQKLLENNLFFISKDNNGINFYLTDKGKAFWSIYKKDNAIK